MDGTKSDMALIPVLDSDFTFRPARHAYLALQTTARFKWLPYNGTVLTAKSERTVLAHVIVPVDGDDDAAKIVGSCERRIDGDGNFVLSFEYDGEDYDYEFEMKGDWLVLEE